MKLSSNRAIQLLQLSKGYIRKVLMDPYNSKEGREVR
jgi:hypothetical protein